MSSLTCNRCHGPLPAEKFNSPELFPCPSCQSLTQALVFPAFYQEPRRGEAGETLVVGSEASCFYHPQKMASVPCDRCGRFLCGLCDVVLGAEHICPVCLESNTRKGKLDTLETKRVLHDSIALTLVFYLTPVTAIASIYIALRHWNKPGSLVRKGKTRYILAIVISALELIAWAFLIYLWVT